MKTKSSVLAFMRITRTLLPVRVRAGQQHP